MAQTRQGRFAPQGTRGARHGSQKQISTRRNRKPNELTDPLEYKEGVYDLQRIREVRDHIVDYVDEETGQLWRQLRGGNRDLELPDFRLPQSLDQYGRVARIWDTRNQKFLSGTYIQDELNRLQKEINTLSGTIWFEQGNGARGSGGASNIWDYPSLILRDANTDWVRTSAIIPEWAQNTTYSVATLTHYFVYGSVTGTETIQVATKMGVIAEVGQNTYPLPLSTQSVVATLTSFRLTSAIQTASNLYLPNGMVATYIERYGSGAVDNFAGSVHWFGAKLEIA